MRFLGASLNLQEIQFFGRQYPMNPMSLTRSSARPSVTVRSRACPLDRQTGNENREGIWGKRGSPGARQAEAADGLPSASRTSIGGADARSLQG